VKSGLTEFYTIRKWIASTLQLPGAAQGSADDSETRSITHRMYPVVYHQEPEGGLLTDLTRNE